MSLYVRIAVPRPLDQTFLYRLPEGLADQVQPGSRVIVPFGRRELTGWVDEVVREPEERPKRIREVLDAPDAQPVLDPAMLALCRWISEYYAAPLGLVFRAALPAALTAESAERMVRRDGGDRTAPTGSEQELLDFVDRHSGPVKLSSARRALGPGPWARAARRLEEAGLIERQHETPDTAPPVPTRQVVHLTRELASLRERDRVFGRARRQRELFEYLESVGGRAEVVHVVERLGVSRSVVRGLAERGLAEVREEEMRPDPFAAHALPEETVTHTPTPAQARMIERLIEAASSRDPGVHVLRGVTSSGKTLVYIELLREIVGRGGRGAILLVPEIALTPQTVARFRAAFGDRVAVLHSALSGAERFAAWRALRAGEKGIAIGARSAIFAPVQDPGAIILDEEHEGSYKQSDPAPRYHAREVAVVRARSCGALCLLGSATPSLESWSRIGTERWQLHELPERIAARPLPAVQVVDLREARGQSVSGNGADPGSRPRGGPLALSDPLHRALSARLRRGEQAILLLNRRGYATFVQCRECGAVRGCPDCNVSLTHHRRPPRLVCHHCNHQAALPERCAECGSSELSHRGLGTEQVERVLGEAFPGARVARMDVDTTSAKWSHHQILGRVERREVDILLGTQMIAKGLDFPGVTLVGVINADVGLSLPDFRASERTFQLLTQVAGRAGRGPAGGEVIVQTALPDHYAIRFAVAHDYEGFAARELEERREPRYPPHVRLANLLFSGRDQAGVVEAAEDAGRWLDGLFEARGIDGLMRIGPAPCPIDRIRGRWRWHLLLKAEESAPLGPVLVYFSRKYEPPSSKVRAEVDRDPASLL